ncbi:MAG: hypothetical protein KZQ82_00025 [Candidatus Thiodiazotropha sp. (ex Lucinoma annulata)]|nr:hypothetical protein [Candidatus Thiodiazotropha sp. (ex Troendleina suluensis)]MCU7882568.1 hypothetical protein [Candidatus Thiodiazotropha sp. (ex Lucinoma annulata)]
MKYLHLQPEQTLPKWPDLRPYQAVVVIEEKVSSEWQEEVSEWLVETGCLYMMAWGLNCSSWDDSVDMANLKKFNYEKVPESEFVLTTWHENEPLKEVFFYSKNNAIHPVVGVLDPVIVHISKQDMSNAHIAEYENA